MNKRQLIGEDWLSKFLGWAQENMELAFTEMPEHWSFLTELNHELGESVFHYSGVHYEKRQAGYLLLAISHDHFIAAIRMAMSGQCLAVFPAGRAAVESSLYSWYLIHHPDAEERWFNKPSNPDGKRAWGKEFSFRSIVDELGKDHELVKKRAISLHEFSIAYGSHPNAMSVYSNIVRIELEGIKHRAISYLHKPKSLPFINAIKFVIETGLFILEIICISDQKFAQTRKLEERHAEFVDRYHEFVDRYIEMFQEIQPGAA